MVTKICFTASSGGHLEQIMKLKPLMDKYNGFLITEDTKFNKTTENGVYYLKQINRKEALFIFKFIANFYLSFKIYLKNKPDMIISTGALATIPICLIGKLFGKKLIFIESFAKVYSPTLTGRILYKLADRFYVQWEDLQEIYPKSIYKGGLV